MNWFALRSACAGAGLSRRPDHGATGCYARGWRESFIGQRLLDLLDGHCELHVSGWPKPPHLEIVTHNSRLEGRKANFQVQESGGQTHPACES